jgi:hypothetical protein
MTEEGLTRSEIFNTFDDELAASLVEGGFASISSLIAAGDDELLAVKGVGPAKLRHIREVVGEVIEARQAQAPAATEEAQQVSQQVYQFDTEYEVVEPFGGYEKGEIVMNLGRALGLKLVQEGKLRKRAGGLEGFSNPRPVAVSKMRTMRANAAKSKK